LSRLLSRYPYTDEALWTNGPKEAIEFFDYYLFDEHFDCPLPVYMPRQPVWIT